MLSGGPKKGIFTQNGLINICNKERVYLSVQLTLVIKVCLETTSSKNSYYIKTSQLIYDW